MSNDIHKDPSDQNVSTNLKADKNEALLSERPRRRTRRANLITLVLLICGTAWAFLASWFEPWTLTRIAGMVIFLGGAVLAYTARLQLGTSFSITAQAQKLVTTGLYSKIQNPIYIFGTVSGIGLILFLNQPIYVLITLALIPVQIIRIKNERRILTERFGDEYRRYRDQTWF